MFQKMKDMVNLVQNMGLRYVAFRSKHEILLRTGLLKSKFPDKPSYTKLPTLEQWRATPVNFFFAGKDDIPLEKNPGDLLHRKYQELTEGNFTFFNSLPFHLGGGYDWVTNPENGYKYDCNLHWTEVADFSKQAGDIKFVWEKSRFSFLYTVIRYDFHFEKDCAEFALNEINAWIDNNPVNRGPNYRCSQEITLRVLNWLFVLHYYKNNPLLTEDVFQKIIFSIYWQIKHVYSHIHFSRIAVRNNHAITETMGLYLCGILLPFFPEALKWKKDGKKWFEQEIAYQIYPDGTFLQFSMNYHRVVVQLFSWCIRISELNKETLDKVVAERASASLHFLYNCMNKASGELPNYGANDGALFFPLNDSEFRDYRPQLQALAAVLREDNLERQNEDQAWYGIANDKNKKCRSQDQGLSGYPTGGYYLLREKDAFTFIRCGKHKDRPSQADNLHLDVWVNGKNVLGDGGSYKYNADEQSLRYFFGTPSHNTLMLGDFDQMKKGGRFIWYYWTQATEADWIEYDQYYEFKGSIRAFQQIDPRIIHSRCVRKYKGQLKWEVTDEVRHATSLDIHQLWHPLPVNKLQLSFISYDEEGNRLIPQKNIGWHSAKYGVKEAQAMLVFSSGTNKINTIIEIKNIG